ncbi:MAG: hypothetical protein WCQ16_01860 [Verrucomicrobiae bacterium]
MEPRKYSTGTKGRLKMHCDKCREFIHANSPTFGLANEFIESLDPDREERVWQRFQSPADILPELQAWLGGGVEKPDAARVPLPAIPGHPEIVQASHLARDANLQADAALQKTRAWLASAAAELVTLSPHDVAEAALHRFYKELTGSEPQGGETCPNPE